MLSLPAVLCASAVSLLPVLAVCAALSWLLRSAASARAALQLLLERHDLRAVVRLCLGMGSLQGSQGRLLRRCAPSWSFLEALLQLSCLALAFQRLPELALHALRMDKTASEIIP